MDFAEHSAANFVIQHLISNTPSEELGREIIQELSPAFESLLFQNRAGVVAKLSDLCLKFPSLQSSFMEVRVLYVVLSKERFFVFIDMMK